MSNGNGETAQSSVTTLGIERLCYCGHSKSVHQPNCMVVFDDKRCFCPAGFLPLDLAMMRILEQGFNNMNATLAVLAQQLVRIGEAVEKLEGSKLILPGH